MPIIKEYLPNFPDSDLPLHVDNTYYSNTFSDQRKVATQTQLGQIFIILIDIYIRNWSDLQLSGFMAYQNSHICPAGWKSWTRLITCVQCWYSWILLVNVVIGFSINIILYARWWNNIIIMFFLWFYYVLIYLS